MWRLKTTVLGILLWAFVSLAVLNFLLEMNLLQRLGISVRRVLAIHSANCIFLSCLACLAHEVTHYSARMPSAENLSMTAFVSPSADDGACLSSQEAYRPENAYAAVRGPRGDVPPPGAESVLPTCAQGENQSVEPRSSRGLYATGLESSSVRRPVLNAKKICLLIDAAGCRKHGLPTCRGQWGAAFPGEQL